MNEVDIDELRRRVIYYPETGLFEWAKSTCSRQIKGMPAFTINMPPGYLAARVCGTRLLAHRAAWAIHYGRWPDGEIDHINGVKSDNRIDNLRDATRSQNQHNRPHYGNNTSGYKGVSWHKARGRWRAVIAVNGRSRHLGLFYTKEQAKKAYCEEAKKIHGEFANFGEFNETN